MVILGRRCSTPLINKNQLKFKLFRVSFCKDAYPFNFKGLGKFKLAVKTGVKTM